MTTIVVVLSYYTHKKWKQFQPVDALSLPWYHEEEATTRTSAN